MATLHYYGVTPGENMDAVTDDTSTTSKVVELVVDVSVVDTQEKVFLAMEFIKGHMMRMAAKLPAH